MGKGAFSSVPLFFSEKIVYLQVRKQFVKFVKFESRKSVK